MRIGRTIIDGAVCHVRESPDGWVPIEDPYAAFAERRRPADVGPAGVGAPSAPSALSALSAHSALSAPCEPTVLVGIAQNGPSHPSPVQAWLKSPRGVTASGDAVMLRRDAGVTVAEGEIAVVLGRSTEGLTAANAHEYVLGITAVNDLSSPDRSGHDPRNFESKSGVGYTPLGPWIDTDADIEAVALALRVNGRLVAETDASALPVPIRECLAYLSRWTPLDAGDVVMTGAPFTAHPIQPGDVVEVEVGTVVLVTPTR